MRGGLLKTLIVMLLLAAPCVAQTRDQLRRKYGKPETLSHKSSTILVERYNVLTGIWMTVKFGDGERACELRIEPQRTRPARIRRIQVIEAFDAAMLTDELAPESERGRSIKTSNVEFGCSSVVYNEYEHVMIAVVTLCPQQGGGVQSMTIRWKEKACERVDKDNKPGAAAGMPE
jgi:hypothetical protein